MECVVYLTNTNWAGSAGRRDGGWHVVHGHTVPELPLEDQAPPHSPPSHICGKAELWQVYLLVNHRYWEAATVSAQPFSQSLYILPLFFNLLSSCVHSLMLDPQLPKQHQLLRVSSKASCHGNHPQLKGISVYPSLEPVYSMDPDRKTLQCDPSWSLLPQGRISFPVLIASPQLTSLLARSGICVHQRNLYPHLQLPRTPTSKRTSRNQPKGEHAWQRGGGFRYYEISGASTTAPEERQEWYPANTASSKASEKIWLFIPLSGQEYHRSIHILFPMMVDIHLLCINGCFPRMYSTYASSCALQDNKYSRLAKPDWQWLRPKYTSNHVPQFIYFPNP